MTISIYGLLSAFYSAINNKPSICTSEMLGTVAHSKYQQSFIELNVKSIPFSQRIKSLCAKDPKKNKDVKKNINKDKKEEKPIINKTETQEKIRLLDDNSYLITKN